MHQAMFLMAKRAGIILSSRAYEASRNSISDWLKTNNPMHNAESVARCVNNRIANGHSQSDVAKRRNAAYWADDAKRKLRSEQNKARTRARGVVFKVTDTTNGKVYLYWHKQSVLDKTGAKKSTLEKYLRNSYTLLVGTWRIDRVHIKETDGITQD
jgi:hypothetical protein